MPRLNHLALMCKLSKKIKNNNNVRVIKKKKKTPLNSVPVVEDGAKREGVVL